jgi:cation transport ATPase
VKRWLTQPLLLTTPHCCCCYRITAAASVASFHRAEVAPGEEVAGLTADAILARKSQPFLTLMGLMAILDPPRDEAIAAVKVAHRAGIVVKMITGRGRHGHVAWCSQFLVRGWLHARWAVVEVLYLAAASDEFESVWLT